MGTCGSLLRVKHGSTIKDAVPYARHNNTIKPVQEIWAQFNGALVKVWTAVSVAVFGNFSKESAGGALRRDRAVCSVSRTPTTLPVPTAYAWSVVDFGGVLSISGGTGPTVTLVGPFYNPASFNTQYDVQVYCDVDIAGQTYRTPTRTLTYTVDGAG